MDTKIYPELEIKKNQKILEDKFIRSEDLAIIIKATDFAARRHRTQRRNDVTHTPFINHCIGVAFIITNEAHIYDPILLTAALLHDIIEDTKTKFEEIYELFGQEVHDIVKECTLTKGMSKHNSKKELIEKASTLSEKAKIVLMADKLYNLRDVLRKTPLGWDHKRIHRYFSWVKELLNQLKGTNDILEMKLDDVINSYFEK